MYVHSIIIVLFESQTLVFSVKTGLPLSRAGGAQQGGLNITEQSYMGYIFSGINLSDTPMSDGMVWLR